jgi:hypothetical protein
MPAHDDADKVGGVLGIEFLDYARPVKLDRPRADPQLAAGLLVGGAGDDLGQHIAFAAGERLTAWNSDLAAACAIGF